jgi:hypothetical protein
MATQKMGQCFFQAKEPPQERQTVARRELHQEVGIAGVWMEVRRARGRAKHHQPLGVCLVRNL